LISLGCTKSHHGPTSKELPEILAGIGCGMQKGFDKSFNIYEMWQNWIKITINY